MSLTTTLRTNTLWVLGGDLGVQAMSLAFGIILARLLMPADFGLLVTAQILTGALGFLAANGTSDALVRARTLGPRDVHTLFALQLGSCALIYVALNLFAPTFAGWFHEPRLTPLLRITSLGFLLRPFMAVPTALLHRAMRFREFSVVMFAGGAVAGLVSTLLALLGLGAVSLAWGGLAGALVRILLSIRRAAWVPALGFDPAAARRLGVYGFKLSVNDIIQYARAQAANALISRRLGAGPVGLYNKADSLAEMPCDLLSGAAYQTLFRALAAGRDDRDACARLYLRALTLVSLYAMPLYVGLLWVAEPLVVVLYGEPWAAAALPLQVLALVGPLRVIANLARAVAASHNRLGREILIQLETLGLLLLGAAVGLHWGLIGVAVCVVPSFIHNAVRMAGLANRTLGLTWGQLARALWPILRLNGIMALVLAATHLGLTGAGLAGSRVLYLAAMVSTGAAVYAGILLWLPPTTLREESRHWRTVTAALFRNGQFSRK